MQTLPVELFTAAQVRAMDQAAIHVHGIDGYTLMNRAGAAVMSAIRARFPSAQRILVVCGAGNNGGDGYVIARLAREQGLMVDVSALVPSERLGGDAAQAWSDFALSGGVLSSFSASLVEQADLVVDALLGTGLDREVSGAFAETIKVINARASAVLAVDIPSGLDADSGAVRGIAIRSHVTVTFVGLKQGLFIGQGRDQWRFLDFSDLDIPEGIAANHRPTLKCLDTGRLGQVLAPRARDSHKGSYGSLLLVGGGPGMAGAIRLAAEAALRSGVGLVRVATWPDNLTPVVAGRPEIICHGVNDESQLADLLAQSDAVVLGPGLGVTSWARALWRTVLASDLPLILDADGLNLLAEAPESRGNWVLTPHPGEAGRLLALDTRSVQADRLAAAAALTERYGGVVVLKGSGSLVAAPGAVTALSLAGNPGMASAGMGDVLAGLIGGLQCQINDLGNAARTGVLIHGLAGDAAAAEGERGMVASDLFSRLRQWVNP